MNFGLKKLDYSKEPYLRITFYSAYRKDEEEKDAPIKNNRGDCKSNSQTLDHRQRHCAYFYMNEAKHTQSPAALNQLRTTYFDAMNENAFVFATRYRIKKMFIVRTSVAMI